MSDKELLMALTLVGGAGVVEPRTGFLALWVIVLMILTGVCK